MPFAVLGVRLPIAALLMPPVRTPRCGHKHDEINCPICGISSDIAQTGSVPISGFDPAAKKLFGYSIVRSGDSFYAGVVINGHSSGLGFNLSLESFAEIYFGLKNNLAKANLWEKCQGFGMWFVEETL